MNFGIHLSLLLSALINLIIILDNQIFISIYCAELLVCFVPGPWMFLLNPLADKSFYTWYLLTQIPKWKLKGHSHFLWHLKIKPSDSLSIHCPGIWIDISWFWIIYPNENQTFDLDFASIPKSMKLVIMSPNQCAKLLQLRECIYKTGCASHIMLAYEMW